MLALLRLLRYGHLVFNLAPDIRSRMYHSLIWKHLYSGASAVSFLVKSRLPGIYNSHRVSLPRRRRYVLLGLAHRERMATRVRLGDLFR